MTAAMRSRPECSASERTPRLPVRITRKAFSETSSTAEPTLSSAALRFSRASSFCSDAIDVQLDYLKYREIPHSVDVQPGQIPSMPWPKVWAGAVDTPPGWIVSKMTPWATMSLCTHI